MKKSLKYNIQKDNMRQNADGLMEVRMQHVTFTKDKKDGEIIIHHARIIIYVDVKKRKLIRLVTNDMDSYPDEIIDIYRQRWEIELLFKQMKQNFPLKYIYGESANAIKIQISKAYNPYRPYSKKFQWIYEYRHTDGELFSAIAPTLELCRQWRDEWLAERSNNSQ